MALSPERDIQSIETLVGDTRYRSRTEARWATFFEALEVDFAYEPERIRLSTGESYLPDFYLPQFSAYLEVKADNEPTSLQQGVRHLGGGTIEIKAERGRDHLREDPVAGRLETGPAVAAEDRGDLPKLGIGLRVFQRRSEVHLEDVRLSLDRFPLQPVDHCSLGRPSRRFCLKGGLDLVRQDGIDLHPELLTHRRRDHEP